MKPTKTLAETVDLMLSNDPTDQFKAEYYQLENRYIELNEKLLNADLGKTDSLGQQAFMVHDRLNSMRLYLINLRSMAEAEGIKL